MNYMLYYVYFIRYTNSNYSKYVYVVRVNKKITIFYRLFAFVPNLRVCIYQIRQIININHCVFVQNTNNIKYIIICLRKSLLPIAKFILCQLAAIYHIIENKDVFPMFQLLMYSIPTLTKKIFHKG